MISVVMATYNGEKYIRKQIESILNQELPVDEIIISDDDSTDNTFEILKDYEKKYSHMIRVLKNCPRKGYIRNFWDAAFEARGEIIIFSDQDDIWEPFKTKFLVKLFDENRDALAINTAYRLVDENDVPIENYKNIKFKNDGAKKWISFHDFIKSPRYPGMSMAIRKELLQNFTDVDTEYLHSHDWFLNQAAAYKNGMLFVDRITACYRQHSKNTDGVSSVISGDAAFKRRLRVINDQIEGFKCLMVLHADDESEKEYFALLLDVAEKRLDYVQRRKLLAIIAQYIKNAKHISLRDFLGDSYSILRR